MVADKEVDKLADMVVGHGCFDPNLTRRLACLLSKLCKFIKYQNRYFEEHSSTHKYLTFKCKDSTLDLNVLLVSFRLKLMCCGLGWIKVLQESPVINHCHCRS